jgi:hypothetical protein
MIRLLCLAAVCACAHQAKPTGAATMHVQLTLTKPRIATIYEFEAQVTSNRCANHTRVPSAAVT